MGKLFQDCCESAFCGRGTVQDQINFTRSHSIAGRAEKEHSHGYFVISIIGHAIYSTPVQSACRCVHSFSRARVPAPALRTRLRLAQVCRADDADARMLSAARAFPVL